MACQIVFRMYHFFDTITHVPSEGVTYGGRCLMLLQLVG